MSIMADPPRTPIDDAPASPPNPPWWSGLVAQARRPGSLRALTIGVWALTRLALLAGVILGQRYCDPWWWAWAGW